VEPLLFGLPLSGDPPIRREETLSLTVTLSDEQRIEVSQASARLVERLGAKQPGLINFWNGRAWAITHASSACWSNEPSGIRLDFRSAAWMILW